MAKEGYNCWLAIRVWHWQLWRRGGLYSYFWRWGCSDCLWTHPWVQLLLERHDFEVAQPASEIKKNGSLKSYNLFLISPERDCSMRMSESGSSFLQGSSVLFWSLMWIEWSISYIPMRQSWCYWNCSFDLVDSESRTVCGYFWQTYRVFVGRLSLPLYEEVKRGADEAIRKGPSPHNTVALVAPSRARFKITNMKLKLFQNSAKLLIASSWLGEDTICVKIFVRSSENPPSWCLSKDRRTLHAHPFQIICAIQSKPSKVMHEIITLQLGQRSNYLATHFWNTQVRRHLWHSCILS